MKHVDDCDYITQQKLPVTIIAQVHNAGKKHTSHASPTLWLTPHAIRRKYLLRLLMLRTVAP